MSSLKAQVRFRTIFRFSMEFLCAVLVLATGSQIIADDPRQDVSFEIDVMAVLAKAGCNAGTCHGNINGKGGFFLSLRGQDPDFDYRQLTQSALARRVNPIVPERSLILQKATTQVPHEGGQRFHRESPEYEILFNWIASGVPTVNTDAPTVTLLKVTPEDTVLWTPENQQPLKAIAHFSDGSQRDITRLAVYEPSDPLVDVTPEGVVQFHQPGLVTVIVRYLDSQVPVRLAYRPQVGNFVWSDPPVENLIDEEVFSRLKQLKINPAPLTEDNVFLRRISLDLLGVLPSADEAREFVADPSPDKREHLIDRLLDRPEFAAMWALKWSDIVRNEEKTLDAKGVERLHEWMVDSFSADKPINQFAKELLASRGSTYDNPPTNYWRAHREPFVRAETTAQVFLGVRLQCAKCHNHPFDRWSQDEYYEWASLFARIDYEVVENHRRDKLDKHEFVGEQIVKILEEGDVKNARTGDVAPPHFLGSDQAVPGDRLHALAEWATSPENRMFATAQVNRIWYHIMGRGLVEPVDDLRTTNPASHPQLLARLTDDFIQNQFRLKHLVKTIVLSRTYQLASSFSQDTVAPQHHDEQLYARAVIRRLTAEQILDAQSKVLGLPAKFEGYPQGTRAGEIAGVERVRRESDDGDTFLKLFGKPERLLACECERSDEPTLGQALTLVGGRSLNERLQHPENRIGKLLSTGMSHESAINELFWTALTRPPTTPELNQTLALIESTGNPRLVLEDLTWALLNAKELIFRN
ncbi:MAG: DUF1549 domain-containing protein [Planctomycetaceae bacterium]|nr:DUF1549 domain-containing protein [Planctomycetaceae bacterium]